jgi:DNA processing protein
VSGTLPDPALRTVGIVGTRRSTPYGERVARELASALARAGAVIVSGLAQGIDSTAHAGAVMSGGKTIAVLGEGLLGFDEHGPLRRRLLAKQIRDNGALVSEYALDVRPTDWTFPRRNRTIAALSDVVVVVEAPEESGALITADRAMELRRPLYAAPGPIGAPTWVGSNRLIQYGRAKLLGDTAEIADLLGLRLGEARTLEGRGDVGDRVIAILEVGPADTDSIAQGLKMRLAETSTILAELLIAGHIVATGDGRFARR